MTRPNVPDRGTCTRSEEGVDMVTTVMKILRTGLLRFHVPAQVPSTTEMILPRISGARDIVVKKIVNGTEQTQNPPENISIGIPTVRVPSRDPLWT